MKLLIVSFVYYPDVIGGGEFSTRMVAEGLVEKGHKVDVLCLGLQEEINNINGVIVYRKYIPNLSEEFIKITKNNLCITGGYSNYEKILHKYEDLFFNKRWYMFYTDIIRQGKYDLVHSAAALSYMGRYNFWKAAHDQRVPVSHVLRSPNLIEFNFFNGILNGIYRKINARESHMLSGLASPSSYMLDKHKKYGITCKLSKVINNAIDVKILSPSISDLALKENMVLYAGDVRKEKGILTLLQAVRYSDCIPKLKIIGRGALTKNLKNEHNVEVIDWLEQKELYQQMRFAKVVILPSEWEEAFGRILIEAIANGTIAIGSDRGGIPEVLNHETKYIFSAGNALDLNQKMTRILKLTREEYLADLYEQQSWLTRYTREKYCNEWEEFFISQLK